MKRVLLDTNVVLDIVLKRQPHFKDAAELFLLIDDAQIIGYLTASTITDIYYISRRELGRNKSLEFISDLVQVVEVIGVDKDTIIAALKSELNDFEDAVQLAAAEYEELDYIITRNTDDFANSAIPVFTPSQFLKSVS